MKQAKKGLASMSKQKTCAYCGKVFTPSAEHRTLCSYECKEAMDYRNQSKYNYEKNKRAYELRHPGEEYKPKSRRGRPRKDGVGSKKRQLADHLLKLKAEGKDYIEEQKKDTIEKYARIIV